jgi:hypothetical protein
MVAPAGIRTYPSLAFYTLEAPYIVGHTSATHQKPIYCCMVLNINSPICWSHTCCTPHGMWDQQGRRIYRSLACYISEAHISVTRMLHIRSTYIGHARATHQKLHISVTRVWYTIHSASRDTSSDTATQWHQQGHLIHWSHKGYAHTNQKRHKSSCSFKISKLHNLRNICRMGTPLRGCKAQSICTNVIGSRVIGWSVR